LSFLCPPSRIRARPAPQPAGQVRKRKPLGAKRINMNEFWNTLSQQLKPRFHEITLYLIALAFCWLLYFHPELRFGYFVFFTGFETMSPLFIALGLIVTGGLLLSLIHVFIKRKKFALEKTIMGWSILGLSGVTSFFVGTEMITSRSSIGDFSCLEHPDECIDFVSNGDAKIRCKRRECIIPGGIYYDSHTVYYFIFSRYVLASFLGNDAIAMYFLLHFYRFHNHLDH
jgi:hypothetical protein